MPRGSGSALHSFLLRARRADRGTSKVSRGGARYAEIPSQHALMARASVRSVVARPSRRRHRCAFRCAPCQAAEESKPQPVRVRQRVSTRRHVRSPSRVHRAECAVSPAEAWREVWRASAAALPSRWLPQACRVQALSRAPHRRRPRHPAATARPSPPGLCALFRCLAAAARNRGLRWPHECARPDRKLAWGRPSISRRAALWQDLSASRDCGGLRQQCAWVCLAAAVLGS